MSRTNYSSSAKWEEIVGYSRAVRVGNIIEVTGTVAVDDDGNVSGAEDPRRSSAVTARGHSRGNQRRSGYIDAGD